MIRATFRWLFFYPYTCNMAIILGIETATEVCSVALFKSGKELASSEIHEGNMHASALTSLIDETISKAGYNLNDLDAICVSKGPGSYTGLRVGVSTAKGLCYALNKPLLSIGTLEAMALHYYQLNPTETGLVCPMIDARRMEVYAAVYNPEKQEITAPAAIIIDEQSFTGKYEDRHITFIGNGALKCKEVIKRRNTSFNHTFNCSALGLGNKAQEMFDSGIFEDVAYFEPFYLKDFVGTTPKKR